MVEMIMHLLMVIMRKDFGSSSGDGVHSSEGGYGGDCGGGGGDKK